MMSGTPGTPLVTVAMVTYNSAAYVGTAIESVLSSSYTHFELLIADDCSKDNTWEIVSSYRDRRIRAIRNETNLGEYPNRDQCVRLAKGDYLIFIDGDDLVYPHGLEFMTRMLHAFPECGMALMTWFRNNLFYPVMLSSEKFFIGEYFGHGFLGTAFSNVLFRTAALRAAGGLDTAYRCGDDYIRYQIALKHPSLLINDGLTWWRETPGQASQQHQRSGQLFIDSIRLKLEVLGHQACPLPAVLIEKAKANVYSLIGRSIWQSLRSLQIARARHIWRSLRPPLEHMLFPFRRLTDLDPFEGYTPGRPFSYPFEKNPYAPAN